jgi:hypothetical protein
VIQTEIAVNENKLLCANCYKVNGEFRLCWLTNHGNVTNIHESVYFMAVSEPSTE